MTRQRQHIDDAHSFPHAHTIKAHTANALARISRFNAGERGIRAITWVNPQAMATAEALDRELQAKGPRSPLHGLTFVAKDNIDIAGVATTAGSAALTDSLPTTTMEAVQRLQAAGAVLLGKSNMSELALSHGRLGYSATAGTTRNPYNLRRDASGSSSGSAAAVAARFADFALGTDTVGSVRAPASVTGLAGIRPTHGLTPLKGIFPCSPSLDVIGPLAPDVATAGQVLYSMMGDSELAEKLEQATQAVPLMGAATARVGFLTPVPAGHSDVEQAAQAAAQALATCGIEVISERLAQAEDSLWPVLDRIISREFAPAVNDYLEALPGGVGTLDALITASEAHGGINPALLEWLREITHAPFDPDASERDEQARSFARVQVLELFDRHRLDALVFPTIACPASPLFDTVDTTYTCVSDDAYQAAYIAAATGLPEITVPVGTTRHGLPIGLSMMGKPYTEPTLVSLGRILERVVQAPAAPALDQQAGEAATQR